MKLVIDSNVLFTYFWKESISKELFLNQDLDLSSPEFALEEINRYSDEIMKKTKLSQSEFNELKKELAVLVEFIPLKEYSASLKKAERITPDKDDVDFIALSITKKCSLWSNDKAVKKIKEINILNTKEVIDLFD